MTDNLHTFVRLVALTIGFAVVAGCSSTSGDHEEVEHTRPAHWPDTFVDLVEQLDDRFRTRDSVVEDAELADQLKWLPEVAGDTGLVEADWNEAVAAGQELVAIYEAGGDARPAIQTLRSLAEKTRDEFPPFVPGRHKPPVDPFEDQPDSREADDEGASTETQPTDIPTEADEPEATEADK